MAAFGIRKGLEDVANELKGIKTILSCIWHSKYQDGETDKLNPEMFADEYISTEECAERLGISDQTIRNWIGQGKSGRKRGWVEGIHYVNVCPDTSKRAIIRIPWNQLIASFSKNKDVNLLDFTGNRAYADKKPVDV